MLLVIAFCALLNNSLSIFQFLVDLSCPPIYQVFIPYIFLILFSQGSPQSPSQVVAFQRIQFLSHTVLCSIACVTLNSYNSELAAFQW